MLHMASKPMVRVQCDQEIGLKPFDNPAQPALRIAFCFPEGADGLAGIFRNLQGGIGEGIFRPQDRHPEEEHEGEPWGKADHAMIPSGLPKEKRSVIVIGSLHLARFP
jgi:hypothetical protein